jgi:MFS transporter, AAHS family, 4-hydroxybenzoate transporter
MIDGFDTQAAAFVAPVLRELWQVGPQQLGLVFAAGLVGIMLGQLLIAPLADRIGRRPVIIGCTILFAIGSLATLLSNNWMTLLGMRLFTGLGLGGATPNLIALTAEHAPPKSRATIVTAMFAGFPLGAALGGLVSAQLIPVWGWKSVFVLGGVLPLLLLFALIPGLPESPHFARAGAAKGHEAGHSPASKPISSYKAMFAALLAPERRSLTLLLWVAFFNSLLMVYFLMSWLPTVAKQAGLPLNTAIVSAVFLNLGGAIGGVLLGRLSDGFGAYRVLAVGYAIAGACIALLGIATQSPTALMALVFTAGLFTIGGQTAMNAATSEAYPAEMRASALGIALAIGRFGSILGPTVGGLLLAANWPLPNVFACVAVPGLIVMGVCIVLSLRGARP